MSDTSAHLQLPYLLAAQAQKHVTHNEALRMLDGIVQLSVLDRHLATPPGAPAEGDRYIVAASASGDWTGWDNSVAYFVDGAWMRLVPAPTRSGSPPATLALRRISWPYSWAQTARTAPMAPR